MNKLKITMMVACTITLIATLGSIASFILFQLDLIPNKIGIGFTGITLISTAIVLICENKIRQKIGVTFKRDKPTGDRILAYVDYGAASIGRYEILTRDYRGLYYDQDGDEVPTSCIKEHAEF